MSQWKRIHEQATGALPVATLTKWGAALIALLLAAFLLTQSLFNSAPEEVEPLATGSQEPAGPGAQAQVAARIREEGLRQEAQRQAAERDLQRRRELGITPPRATASLLPSGVIGGDPIMPSSEAEAGVARGIAPGRDRAAQPLTPVRAGGADLPGDEATSSRRKRRRRVQRRRSHPALKPHSHSRRYRRRGRPSSNRWKCSGRPSPSWKPHKQTRLRKRRRSTKVS